LSPRRNAAHTRTPHGPEPSPRWARLLLLLLFCLHLGNTGLPGVQIHHSKSEGIKHCNCGCDCGLNPDAPASCLNPRNTEGIQCGCRKEHSRVLVTAAPVFSDMLLAHSTLSLPTPDGQRLWMPEAPRIPSRPMKAQPAPPS